MQIDDGFAKFRVIGDIDLKRIARFAFKNRLRKRLLEFCGGLLYESFSFGSRLGLRRRGKTKSGHDNRSRKKSLSNAVQTHGLHSARSG